MQTPHLEKDLSKELPLRLSRLSQEGEERVIAQQKISFFKDSLFNILNNKINYINETKVKLKKNRETIIKEFGQEKSKRTQNSKNAIGIFGRR